VLIQTEIAITQAEENFVLYCRVHPLFLSLFMEMMGLPAEKINEWIDNRNEQEKEELKRFSEWHSVFMK
jgi:hypothetical protein